MAHASASPDSPESTATFLHAHHPALATGSALQANLKCHAFAMKASRVMIALRRLAPTTARDTASALRVCVHAKMALVVQIAPTAALVKEADAVATESAWMSSATATQAGLDMPAISEHACTIALSTDIATTAPACARRDTEDVIALCPLSPSLASAPSIACVVVCNSAPRFTSRRVLVHPTTATHSAHKSVFHSVLPERCQLTCLEKPRCLLNLQMYSLTNPRIAFTKLMFLLSD
jgi:hypothetical protein